MEQGEAQSTPPDRAVTPHTEFGRGLTQAQLDTLARYTRALLEANARINLTAVRDPAEVERRHIAESLALLRSMEAAAVLPCGASLVDVGSGGGLPGIPIAIARPDLRVVLLEATGKKAAFLREVVAGLSLAGTAVVSARAEDAGREPVYREAFDVAIARAVAPLDALAELLLPLVRVGGWMGAVKGSRVSGEIAAASAAISRCGGRFDRMTPLGQTGTESMSVVLIEKVSSTPPDLPRRAGMPAKRPLR